MSEKKKKKLFLEKIHSPEDLKGLNIEDLKILSSELREELIEIVSKTGGHQFLIQSQLIPLLTLRIKFSNPQY